MMKQIFIYFIFYLIIALKNALQKDSDYFKVPTVLRK
tara:strand:- start:637 stop:747 length:111 start_codon:yes stop_codon:yes gene_type:complete